MRDYAAKWLLVLKIFRKSKVKLAKVQKVTCINQGGDDKKFADLLEVFAISYQNHKNHFIRCVVPLIKSLPKMYVGTKRGQKLVPQTRC